MQVKHFCTIEHDMGNGIAIVTATSVQIWLVIGTFTLGKYCSTFNFQACGHS